MMPSTAPKKSPNYARRIKWLGIGTAVVFALYSAGWFYIAKEGKRRVDEALLKTAQTGQTVSCEQSEIKGYPFRIGLFCNSVSFEEPAKGVRFSASALRSAAQVYDPKHAIIELDGPADITLPKLPPLTINWALLHSSIRVSNPVPERLSIESKDLRIAMQTEAATTKEIATAAYAAAHMRTEQSDVSFAGEGDDVLFAQNVMPERVIPQFSASYDIVLNDGVNVLAAKPKSLRGLNGTIRLTQIIFKDGGTLKLTGPVSVDAEGLVDSDLSITIKDGVQLSAALSKAAPKAASIIKTALSTASAAAGPDKETKLDIKIRKGKIAIGFFPFGQIPPL